MEIKKISTEEISEAMKLVWDVFQEFEAPDYSSEGINTFKEFIDGQLTNLTIELYGAFEEDALLGVIATRSEGSHIALFFVRKDYDRQGVGRKLFEHILSANNSNSITVNSSPYAVKIYRKLGFVDLDSEQLTHGLRYIPMKHSS